MAQVITNIVGNAIKFTPERGSISIKADLLRNKNDFCTIRISVTDTGIGISAEQQKLLFRSFQQADSTGRVYGGSGLGLAISKNIVNMMNGDIWIESELGKGSTFSFTANLGYGNPDITCTEDFETSFADVSFAGKHILLAEDVEVNQEIIMALLEPTNVSIDCVNNGQSALNIFRELPQKYDLILMDLAMPVMDGHQAARAIRALDIPRAKTIPIIAVSANVFKEDIEASIAAGMNDHIGKPVALPTLISTLRSYL